MELWASGAQAAGCWLSSNSFTTEHRKHCVSIHVRHVHSIIFGILLKTQITLKIEISAMILDENSVPKM